MAFLECVGLNCAELFNLNKFLLERLDPTSCTGGRVLIEEDPHTMLRKDAGKQHSLAGRR